jgi:DNA/RNA endonuclease YhcR with UshA esterase domain
VSRPSRTAAILASRSPRATHITHRALDLKPSPMASSAPVMKSITILAALICAFTTQVFAQETQVETSKKTPAKEDYKPLKGTITVTGMVAQVTFREKVTYLNLDKPYPNSPLTCVIFGRITNRFGDLKMLEGKQVAVNGKVEAYEDKLQVILTSTNQLKLLD